MDIFAEIQETIHRADECGEKSLFGPEEERDEWELRERAENKKLIRLCYKLLSYYDESRKK